MSTATQERIELKNGYAIEFEDSPLFPALLFKGKRYVGCFRTEDAVREFLGIK